MAVIDTHQEAEHHGPATQDVIVSGLGALFFALLAWALVFGVFFGANFGLEYFKVAVPGLVTTGLDLGAKYLSWLAAIVAGLLSYKFLINLP